MTDSSLTLRRRALLGGLAAGGLAYPALAPAVRAQGSGPIRIGEINSYTAQPAFLGPYRNGWVLAQEQINAAGGVNGRPLETLHRDDAGKPEDAIRIAGELLNAEKVAFIAGGYLSNVGLALGDYALQNKILYAAGEPLTDALVWSKGNRYTFRLRPSTYMQAAMLVEEAAKLPAKRWATVAPNYEYGQSAVRWFRELLQKAKPDVEFVGEQFPALGRIDAGATVQALDRMRPDAIFNVTFGVDLTNFVRQGNTRGLFENRTVASMLSGEPEYLEPLGEECPEGWIVTGYPRDTLENPVHTAFREAYRKRFNEAPKCGSVVGYDLVLAIAAMLKKAGSTQTEAMVDAFEGIRYPTAYGTGEVEFRKIDHQATLGCFVGRTKLNGRTGGMVDWHYADGANYLPADDVVRGWRPQG